MIEFEDLRNVCRICLGKSKVLILLNEYAYHFDNDVENLLISSVLSDIMSEEIDNNDPKSICLQCLDQLKLAYNLKLQFKESQEVLRKCEKSIIESYINDDLFEVYDSYMFNHESGNSFQSDSTENKLIEGTVGNLVTTLNFGSSGENTTDLQKDEMTADLKNFKIDGDTTENKEIFTNVGEQANVTIPVKIIQLESDDDDKDTACIQVRYVDLNKYIIEKKHESNDRNLGDCHDLFPHVPIVPHEHLKKIDTSDSKNSVFVKCLSCEKLYPKVRLQRHMVHCKGSTNQSLSCKECHRVFKKIKDLNYHVKLKHSPNLFPCKMCGVICENLAAKQLHMRQNHNGAKSFVCEICNKGFRFNAALLRHKSKHTRETQEVCNFCGKSFHYKGALFYHIKMHTNERKYLCNFCERRFYTSQSLQRHLDTHTGVRRFKCQYCEKSFRSTSERRRHEMIHTGEKPHQCNYCEKCFTSKYNLDVHTAAHRGQQQCGFCSGKYLNAEVLQLHIKLKHKFN